MGKVAFRQADLTRAWRAAKRVTERPHVWIENWKNGGRVMAMVELEGVYRVTAKGRTYYYAWRGKGAPRQPTERDARCANPLPCMGDEE